MRIWTILIMLLMQTLFVSAQNQKLNDIFDSFENEEGITSIQISKSMFGLLGSLNLDDSSLKKMSPVLQKLDGMRILILDGENSLKNKQLKDQLTAKLERLKLTEVMNIKTAGSKLQFLTSGLENGFHKELLMRVGDEGDGVLILFDGKVSADAIEKIAKEVYKPNPNSTVSKHTSTPENNGFSDEMRDLRGFKSISAEKGIKVQYTQGKEHKVIVHAFEDQAQYIKTRVTGDILDITIEVPSRKNVTLKSPVVIVESPELADLSVSSGSYFQAMNPVKGENFMFEASSGSRIEGEFIADKQVSISVNAGAKADIKVNSEVVAVMATSAGKAVLQGTTKDFGCSVSSAASVEAQSLVTDIGTISAKSSGSVSIYVKEQLTSKTSSAGRVRYLGKPLVINIVDESAGSTKPN